MRSLSEFTEEEIEAWAVANRPCIGCKKTEPCSCHRAGIDIATRHRIKAILWNLEWEKAKS